MLNEATVRNLAADFYTKLNKSKKKNFLHESIVKMFFLWYTADIIYTLQLYATYNKCFIIQNNV